MAYKVSVIIPTYNRADLVVESILSVYNQTYPSSLLEIIVVDDYSTDHTTKVVCELNIDNLIYVQKNTEKKGACTSRNIGAYKANGDYLLFLDSDDILDDTCIEMRVREAKQNKGMDFYVFNGAKFKSKPGDMNILANIVNKREHHHLDRFLSLDLPWLTPGVLWSSSFFHNIGGWNENLPSWQDWDIHTRALYFRGKYIALNHVDYFIRMPTARSIGLKSTDSSHLDAHEKLILNLANTFKVNDDHKLLMLLTKVSFSVSLQRVLNGELEKGCLFLNSAFAMADIRPVGLYIILKLRVYEIFMKYIRLIPGIPVGKINGLLRLCLFYNYLPPRSKTFHKAVWRS